MENQNIKKGYVVTHTHWDREWRYPVWENRMMLVDLMDTLLDILDNDPKYNNFLMDGQSIIIEDYLEVRPEMKEKVCKYIKEGRISIGPWYTLPDLFPIDGESLVRNLMYGIRFSESLGGHLKVGYNSFGWGQTAQFPQIYSEFDFDFIIVAKSVSRQRAPKSEFLWEGPDGTQIVTSRLGNAKRGNFFMNAYIEIMYGIDYSGKDFRLKWGENGMVYHGVLENDYHKDYMMIENKGYIRDECISRGVKKAWEDINDSVFDNERLIMNGSDFSTPQPLLTKILDKINENNPEYNFFTSSLDKYKDEVISKIDKTKLHVVKGELRDGNSISTSGNALATRSYIKRANKNLENNLYRMCEPLSAMNFMTNGKYEQDFINRAVKYMISAHAHDSINGVTQDKTADDVMYSISQANEISTTVSDKASVNIIKMINMNGYDEKDIIFVCFNTLPFKRNEIVKLYVDFPAEMNVWDFDFVDRNDKILSKQIISRKENTVPVHDFNCRPWPFTVDRYEVIVDVNDIPAGGYKVIRAVPKENYTTDVVFWIKIRTSKGNDISRSNNTLENEYLKATVNVNGTLTLFNKEDNFTYENLNYFEDAGDIGDYWVYYPPYHNKIFTTLGSNAVISVIENGPISATIEAKITLEIPEDAMMPEKGRLGESKRSANVKNLEIVTNYTLKRNEKKIDVKTVVNNNAKDHRLRVNFDTKIKSDKSYAAGHYYTDKRNIEPERDENGEFYPESCTKPMQSFVGLSNGEKSLSIINNCFSEFEILRNEESTIAITLFRSVRNVICTEYRVAGKFPMQNGGQSLGVQEYNYSIYSYPGNWNEENVYLEAKRFNSPLKVAQTSKNPKGTLPEELSFFEIDNPEIILSAIKKTNDRSSIIIRMFNPGDNTKRGTIFFNNKIKEAYKVNLNERRTDSIDFDGNKITIDIKQNKIFTMEIAF